MPIPIRNPEDWKNWAWQRPEHGRILHPDRGRLPYVPHHPPRGAVRTATTPPAGRPACSSSSSSSPASSTHQPFSPGFFAADPFDRFRIAGGITTGEGDWAWLQHTLAWLNERGPSAVVLDTGAVTRGSGFRHQDRERNIHKWFVDHDLIDGVIRLPDNLFYNTSAPVIIAVQCTRKPAARRDRIVLFNASKHVRKGRLKNYIVEQDIRPLAAAFLKGSRSRKRLPSSPASRRAPWLNGRSRTSSPTCNV